VLEVALERVPQALPEEDAAKPAAPSADPAPVAAADTLPH
jgi:hypothetical protein